MYESIGIKKELKEQFNSLKDNLSILYPNELKEFSANDTMKFITSILSEENLKIFNECKKEFYKNNPKDFNFTNEQILKRIFMWYLK